MMRNLGNPDPHHESYQNAHLVASGLAPSGALADGPGATDDRRRYVGIVPERRLT